MADLIVGAIVLTLIVTGSPGDALVVLILYAMFFRDETG